MRMVFDTNVLIDGFQDDYSAQARLIGAALAGEITVLATSAIHREYQKMLRRLIDDPAYKRKISEFLAATEMVEPRVVAVTIDDEEDIKFLQAAVGGGADILVTNDRHLLDVGEAGGVDIIKPEEAWNRHADTTGQSSEWEEFAKGLGIGK